jgi:Protein of unknown function (DUF3592)
VVAADREEQTMRARRDSLVTSRLRVGLSLGCAAIGAALWLLAGREFVPQHALDTRGVRTDAAVTAVQRALEPVATLRFRTAEGGTVVARTREFASAEVGDVLPVTYDPEHPGRVRAASASSDYVGAGLFAAGGAGMLLVTALVAVGRPPRWLWTQPGT